MKLRGGYPARCQSPVIISPEGVGDRSQVAKAGTVLNRKIRAPSPPVIRSKTFIIDASRASLVVMIGTNRFGKPKWDRCTSPSRMARYAVNFLAIDDRSKFDASMGSV